MGKLIVIEGLDGCGKATQTALLAEFLARRGTEVKSLEFPCYDSDSSALVKMYLSGRFGSRPDDVNCYAASMFYAADRFASYKSDWQSAYISGGIMIADRYTTSNAVYQMAKLPPEQWESYCEWLWDFEYVKLGIPKPDFVIYLDMSPEVSERLLAVRYGNDDSKKDIHERDRDFQRRCRKAALWCAERFGWRVIRCDVDGEPKTIEEISAQIIAAVNL